MRKVQCVELRPKGRVVESELHVSPQTNVLYTPGRQGDGLLVRGCDNPFIFGESHHAIERSKRFCLEGCWSGLVNELSVRTACDGIIEKDGGVERGHLWQLK